MTARPEPQTEETPGLLLGDLIKIPTLAFLGVMSWCLPPRIWPGLCRALAGMTKHIFPGRREDEAQRLPPFLAKMMGLTVEEAVQRFVASAYEDYMYALSDHRPVRWGMRLRIVGREHLDAALAAGTGAILWQTDLTHTSLMAKRILAAHGYRVTQISRPEHGFSTSRFGIRFLNPIELGAENRYIRERVVLLGRPEVAARLLQQRLTENGLVCITIGEKALQVIETPFIEGTLQVATGPISLSRSTQAPLIPSFLLQLEPDSFELRLEAPLFVEDGPSRLESYRRVAEAYTSLLVGYVRRGPHTWVGWRPGGNWHSGESKLTRQRG